MLFSRVKTLVFLLDKFLVHMSVDLGGADVGVTQQFLQHAEVHARFEAVGGEAVAEGVGRYLLSQVHGMLLHDLPSAHAAHGLAAGI